MLQSRDKLLLKLIPIVLPFICSINANALENIFFNCEGQNLINGRRLLSPIKLSTQISKAKNFDALLIIKNNESWQFENEVWRYKNGDKSSLVNLRKFRISFDKFNKLIKGHINEDFKNLTLEYKTEFFLEGSDGALKISLAPKLGEDNKKLMSFSFLPERAKIDSSFTLPKRARVIKSANRYVELNEKYGFANRLNISVKSAYLNHGIKCKRDVNALVKWPKLKLEKDVNNSLYDFTQVNNISTPGIFSKILFDRMMQFFITKRSDFFWKEEDKIKAIANNRIILKKMIKKSGILKHASWNKKNLKKEQRIKLLNRNIALYAQKYPYIGIGSFPDNVRALYYSDLYEVLKI